MSVTNHLYCIPCLVGHVAYSRHLLVQCVNVTDWSTFTKFHYRLITLLHYASIFYAHAKEWRHNYVIFRQSTHEWVLCDKKVSLNFFKNYVVMFKNTFQSGFISILYSVGSKPLKIWDKKVQIAGILTLRGLTVMNVIDDSHSPNISRPVLISAIVSSRLTSLVEVWTLDEDWTSLKYKILCKLD